MNAARLIELLALQPHPLEGGYFRRTFQSPHTYIDPDRRQRQRHCATSIFYLLSEDQPIGYLHRNKSDILHCYQLGAATQYFLINGNGQLQTVVLGPDIEHGQQLQLLVPGGVWKASRLIGDAFSLISELVVPGFDYADNELASAENVLTLFPDLYAEISTLIKTA